MTAKEFFSILLPSLAFSVALYAFLSNNPMFREFGRKFGRFVILELIAMLSCSFLAFIEQISIDITGAGTPNIFNKIVAISEYVLKYVLILLFVSSWGYLCYVFYTIYGSLYFMRKTRFLKYMKPFAWIYEKFFHKKSYEEFYRERTLLSIDCLPNVKWDVVNSGGSILLLHDGDTDTHGLIAEYIKQVIGNEETIDYVAVTSHPQMIIQKISEKVDDKDILKIASKLSIIDCFSPYYSFDDKILKFKTDAWKQKGFIFYQADSFASIHTAANSSWYRFRQQCKSEKNYFRIPHRTIFHSLSSLIRFSSEEQFLLYIRHVLASEKAYGMITLLVEPSNLDSRIKNELINSVDIVIKL